MVWLPWKKKKSQLEERDRQRNVPPLLKEAKAPQASTASAGSSHGSSGGGTAAAASRSDAARSASAPAPAGSPSQKPLPDDAILTPCYRGDVDRVRELLSGKFGKVDVHACDALGNTALHLAAFNGHLEVMKLLLNEGGADPNRTNGEKDTALYMAVLSNDVNCVKLISGFNVQFNCTNIEGFTPLHYAAGEGNLVIVRYLVEDCKAETEIPDNLGLTPGFCAVLQGREEVAEYLLNTYPQGVHARNMSSDTMLHCALKANAPKPLVKLLIDHGADLMAVGADNMTCEKMLAARGHHDLISLASASRASTPFAAAGPAGNAAPPKQHAGPVQIPWLKKYISNYINNQGSEMPSKPFFSDAALQDEWHFNTNR